MHCHLIIPDLLWPEPGDPDTFGEHDGPLAPALRTLLAGGQLTRSAASSGEALLALHCGLADAPLAPLRLLGETSLPNELAADGFWLCADPIHLRLAQEQVFAAGNEALAMTSDEATQLVAALNHTFSDIGSFHAAAPDRWYLRLHQPLDFPAPPTSAVAGRRLGTQLPKGKAYAPLLSFLNEAQMLLHSQPLNRQREDARLLTANSLWLWGGGTLPTSEPSATTPIDHLYSNAALAQGIARHRQLPGQPQPANAQQWLADAPQSGRHLLTLDDLLPPSRMDDGYTWRQTLQGLDSDWFAPLLAALRQGRLSSLRLSSCGSYGTLDWQIVRPSLWQNLRRHWQKPETLAALAKRLADSAVKPAV